MFRVVSRVLVWATFRVLFRAAFRVFHAMYPKTQNSSVEQSRSLGVAQDYGLHTLFRNGHLCFLSATYGY